MVQLMTVNEVAAALRISRPTLYRLMGRAEIPYVKVGNRTLFRAEAIRQYIAKAEDAAQQ